MKTPPSRSRILCTVTSLLLGSAPALCIADVVLHKVPAPGVEQATTYPENRARHHLGAKIEIVSDRGNAGEANAAISALLSGDPAASYTVPAGKTTLLVALSKIENIESVSFSNAGAKGTVQIATSNAKVASDSPQWRSAAELQLTTDVEAKVEPGEAKYVRLTFNVSEPGQLSNLGVYSAPQASDAVAARASGADASMTLGLVSYSRTNTGPTARALYVSSGSDTKQASNMIDDQRETTYSFAAEDGSPTTVIDLGKPSTVRRLSAIYSPRAGRVQFYVMQSLPAAANSGSSPNTFTVSDSALDDMKPVGTATDDGSQGRAAVDFASTTGRYVMVRWTPAVQQDSSFTVAEIAAIGGAGQNSTLLAANTSGAAPETDETSSETSDGKTVMDGKTMIDAKDMPGEGPVDQAPQSPGEGPTGPPPTLPQPPPFTFVPVLVPTSP